MSFTKPEELAGRQAESIPAGDFRRVALALGGLSAEPTLLVTFDDVRLARIGHTRAELKHRQQGHMSKRAPVPSEVVLRPGDYLVATRVVSAEGELGEAALYDLAFKRNEDDQPGLASELVIGRDHRLEYRDPKTGEPSRVVDLSGLNGRDTPNIADRHLLIAAGTDDVMVTSLQPNYSTLVVARPSVTLPEG